MILPLKNQHDESYALVKKKCQMIFNLPHAFDVKVDHECACI